jgi:putative endonuclease
MGWLKRGGSTACAARPPRTRRWRTWSARACAWSSAIIEPRRGGGEIDLILRDSDGTLVFVEVRARASDAQGGAAASVGGQAAAHRVRGPALPAAPARAAALPLDVVAIEGERIEWLRAAFDAGG